MAPRFHRVLAWLALAAGVAVLGVAWSLRDSGPSRTLLLVLPALFLLSQAFGALLVARYPRMTSVLRIVSIVLAAVTVLMALIDAGNNL